MIRLWIPTKPLADTADVRRHIVFCDFHPCGNPWVAESRERPFAGPAGWRERFFRANGFPPNVDRDRSGVEVVDSTAKTLPTIGKQGVVAIIAFTTPLPSSALRLNRQAPRQNRPGGPHRYICSSVPIPRRCRPSFSARAVRSHSRRRESRTDSGEASFTRTPRLRS